MQFRLDARFFKFGKHFGAGISDKIVHKLLFVGVNFFINTYWQYDNRCFLAFYAQFCCLIV